MAILDIQKISKRFGEVDAVKELGFSVSEGSVFGLLGPNGAGKTTTIRMIMQIIMPDAGQIFVFGQLNSMKQRDKIGYLPEERGLYQKMKVLDTVLFFAEIKSVSQKQALEKANYWLERFELCSWKDHKVQDLSRGMQQKLQFICTIIHDPKLIILDEPFAGLDPVNTNLLKDIMLELKNSGSTIIFSTHLMDQVEKLCESIILINKGQDVLSGKLSEIKSQYTNNHIRMRYEGTAGFLRDRSLVAEFNDYGRYVELTPADGRNPQEVLKAAMEQVFIESYELTEPSLHDIFIDVVKK